MGNLATTFGTARAINPVPSSGRILVVEDDPAVQKALRRLFESEGYTVEVQGGPERQGDSIDPKHGPARVDARRGGGESDTRRSLRRIQRNDDAGNPPERLPGGG